MEKQKFTKEELLKKMESSSILEDTEKILKKVKVRSPNHKDILVVCVIVFLGFLIWVGVSIQKNYEIERTYKVWGFKPPIVLK